MNLPEAPVRHERLPADENGKGNFWVSIQDEEGIWSLFGPYNHDLAEHMAETFDGRMFQEVMEVRYEGG